MLFWLTLLAAAVLGARWYYGSLVGAERERTATAERTAAARLRSATEELEREHVWLATVLSNMAEAVVSVDTAGRIVVLNPALASLLSLDAAAAQGKPFLEVLRQTALSSLLEAAMREGRQQSGEVRLFTPQERIFEAHAAPMRHEGAAAGALAVLHDVTRLRRLEQTRRDFVANVSHEFRTPLASIRGFAETLKDGVQDREQSRDFAETIESEAMRMERLVDDLLELSAIESGARKPCLERLDPLACAREAAEALAPLAARHRVTITVAAGEPAWAKGDAAQLRQVLVNLLSNAVKFNKEGGSVHVEAAAADGRVRVSVADTGLGIPREDLPRIFERFYRVDKARSRELGGTGLGLAIVKHIVEAHEGAVSVESDEGKGSVFRFTLASAS